ncbi:hypothetical protein [Psychromicrobium sp. YIM B11713]|uniref:hypothetical protein n=1 Tax=Psychromicrobium sp. YIM B11713 TaxID=3145233 RepID=UPI00374E71A2
MNDVGQVLGWVGDHWWFIFLLPVFAGIIRSTFRWDRRYRRRADRRAEAAGIPQAAQQQPSGLPDQGSQRPSEAERLVADHDAVNARWLDYELDVGKLIDYPMMSDVREPLTVDFLRAKRLADGMRPDHAAELSNDAQLAEYRQAVRNYEVSFDIAEREAKRIKDQHFSEPERQRLKTARKLLPMAVDEASTQAERQLAYTRTRKELDGLIVLPDEALAALEKRVQAGISARNPDIAEGQAYVKGAAGKEK